MTAQNMGKKILSESGYDVTTVSNGAAAVKKIAEVKPDVVILDIYMPGYTGLEVCERVRANMDTANLPVLLTVGKMEPYRAEDGAKVRADGVIVKPFEATDLLAVVKKMAEKATPAARHLVPEPEPEPVEEIGQPEPTMPAAVDVPSEMASAPALTMEEFNPAPVVVPESRPTIEWTAAPGLPVEHAAEPEPYMAEIPWTFDQAAVPSGPLEEPATVQEAARASDVEFTSAPQAGDVEVQQVEGLEAGLEAPPTGEIQITTDPALTSAQEMTDFVTSFGETNAAASEEVIAEPPTIEAPAESAWDGWAHAEPVQRPTVEATPGTTEPTIEASPAEENHVAEEPVPQAKPMIDDFEAKVAAAMAGFGVEPEIEHQVEPTGEHHEPASAEGRANFGVDDFEARVVAAMSGFATEPMTAAVEETHTQPEIEAVADDFETRVAAAMSGFATEPVEEEPAVEAHVEPTAEAHVEPAVEESHAEAAPAQVVHDDFDARLAQALSAFDTPPALHDELSAAEGTEPPVEMHAEAPSVQLNETTVLPHEAVLSLEEEMKQALEQYAVQAEQETVTQPASETVAQSAPTESEPEVAPVEIPVTEPEPLGEFDPAHVAEPAPPKLPEVAVAAFAAAAATSTVHAESSAPGPEKFADAVQRAIERLKPQLIAEIVKELKGE